jgi:tetratricopeptide (TPR) repeat protein
MNSDYCFMKRLPSVLIFVLFVTTACSGVQDSSPPAMQEAAPAQSDAAADPVAVPVLEPTDPNVMYHVFTAEVLGADGDFSAAAAEYLEAALISDDPQIAERATRVAVSASEWQMVALASDRWATLEPTSLDARELAAGSRLREGDFVGAEYQLAKILELTASDRGRGWQLVIALLMPANDHVRANKVLDNLLADFDAASDVDALFARSRFAAQTGDLEESGRLVDLAIEQEPGRAEFLAWSGRLAVNQGNNELALSRYQQAWQADHGNLQVAMAYAELLKRNNDPAAGQAVLEQLPDTPEMRFARIVFALDAEDMKSAEALYRGFSENRYRNTNEAAFQAAQSAELLGFPREAINWYKQVEGEESIRSVLRRAFLLAELGDVEEGRNLLANLRLQTDSNIKSQSYQAEAQILQNVGNIEAAVQVLNNGLETLPDDSGMRYMRGLLAVTLGQLELAEADFRVLIAAEPQNAAAINALGYTLADMTDRYEEAEELIFRAYRLQPTDASIIDSMGWIAYRQGRLEESEAYLRDAWELMRNAEIAAHLGEVLWARGKQDEARSIWGMGKEMDAGNDTLVKTLQRFGEQP